MAGILQNKISLVTGGASGIGKSITQLFAREGSKVIFFDINTETGEQTQNEIIEQGYDVRFVLCDISDEKQVIQRVKDILADEKRIDILVNNAGISHIGNIEQTIQKDLDRLYNVNVKSVYLVTKAVIGSMVENSSGTILNMASIASKIGLDDRFAYSMTKGAVLSMTMSIAKDYINKNIRCNCICPARVHTPFVDDFLKKNYAGREKEIFESLSKYQPIGRMGHPDEIAQLALFLCSGNSAFITGVAYDIDGGVINLR